MHGQRTTAGLLTHTEHKVVVGLVVDLIQDVKHLNSKVRQRAEVGGDALLSLEVSTRGLHLEVDRVMGEGPSLHSEAPGARPHPNSTAAP